MVMRPSDIRKSRHSLVLPRPQTHKHCPAEMKQKSKISKWKKGNHPKTEAKDS